MGTGTVFRLCSALAALAAAAVAVAADTFWLAPRAGSFIEPSNWSAGAPRGGTAAVFGSAPGRAPFLVSMAGAPSVAGIAATNQSPVLQLNGSAFACGTMTVGGNGALLVSGPGVLTAN